MTGMIFDVKEFCLHDGPGIRTTVFLKGCPLRCKWCHNPEGLAMAPQLMVRQSRCTHCGCCRKGCLHPECRPFDRCLHACPNGLISLSGQVQESSALADLLLKNADFLNQSGGGVTFSGGEPLFQPTFLFETMALLKGKLHLAIETSGYAMPEIFEQAMQLADYIIMDLKLADPAAHRQHTGCDNAPILQNLSRLKVGKTPFLIRTPLIPGITDTAENLQSIAQLTQGIPHETIPFNALAGAKYRDLGLEYPLHKA